MSECLGDRLEHSISVYKSGVQMGLTYHYENMPMQYTAIFQGCKNNNFQIKTVMFSYFLKTLIAGTR